MPSLTCHKCKQPVRSLVQRENGDLWCRACIREDDLSKPYAPAVFRDEIPGGQVFENYGRDPIKFYSHSERRLYMKQHGLHERETFAPMPGTDKDPQGIPNPKGYVDEYTLNAAAELIKRNGGAKGNDADTSNLMKGQFGGVLSDRDARAMVGGDPVRQSRLHRRTNAE